MKRAPAREQRVCPSRLQPLWVLALLLAITLFFYASIGRLAFISYDDPWYVVGNTHVISGLSWENVRWAFTSLELSNWHPLTWLSHMIDCELFGLNPAGHHYDSLLFHGLNVLLLFGLLWKATGHVWRSFYVSALFALHPLNVQSVAWISERKNLLSTLCLFLAILIYGWYVRNPNWKRYLALAGMFAASLMAKPMAVTFPFALLLIDYWLGRLPDPAEALPAEGEGGRPGWWRCLGGLALEKLPLLAMAAASSWITVLAQARSGAMHTEIPLPLRVRLGNAVYSYAEYVRVMFWPARLGIFYPYPVLAIWKVALAGLLLAVITVLVLVYRRRKYLVLGWFWFLGTMVPVIGLVQVGRQGMADRYAYLPLLGLFLMIVWLADEAIQVAHPPRGAVLSVAACVLLALGVVTHINLGYWRNSVALFGHASQVASRPDPIISANLGEALQREGLLDQALRQFRIAEQLDPQYALVHADLGAVLLQEKHEAEAESEFQAAVRDSGNDKTIVIGAYNDLGVIHLQQGRLDEAWHDYSEVLRLNPESTLALIGRGKVLYRQKRYAEAEEEISHAITIQPTAEAWALLGAVLYDHGNRDLAARAYMNAKLLGRQ